LVLPIVRASSEKVGSPSSPGIVRLPEAGVNALIDQNCVYRSFRAIPQAGWVYILAVGEPAL